MPTLPDAHAGSRSQLLARARASDAAIREAVQGALAGQLDQLSGPDPRARAARAAGAVGQALAGAVTQARGDARRASDEAFRREYAAAGGDPADLPDGAGGDAEDEARGAAVGDTFGAAWLAAFEAARADGADPRAAAERALGLTVEERVGRIATTETTHAFAAERMAVAAAHARALAARGEAPPTMVWACESGGSCLLCFAMCGTTRPFGVPWTTGEKPFVEVLWPGQVHPNCACSIHVATVPPRPATKRVVDWPADVSAAARRAHGRR